MRLFIVREQRHKWERSLDSKGSNLNLRCHTSVDTSLLKYWPHESPYGKHLSQELENIPAQLELLLEWNSKHKKAHLWASDRDPKSPKKLYCGALFGYNPPSYVKCYDADTLEIHLNFNNREISFKNSLALVRNNDGTFQFSAKNVHMQSDITDYLQKESSGEVKVSVHVSFPDPGSFHATRRLKELTDLYKNMRERSEYFDFTLKTKDHMEIKCHKSIFVGISGTINCEFNSELKTKLNYDAALSFVKYQYYRDLELPTDNPCVSVELLEFAQEHTLVDLERDVCISIRDLNLDQLCGEDAVKLFQCLAQIGNIPGVTHADLISTLQRKVFDVMNLKPDTEVVDLLVEKLRDPKFSEAYVNHTRKNESEPAPKRPRLNTGLNELDELTRATGGSDHEFSLQPSLPQTDIHSTTNSHD